MDDQTEEKPVQLKAATLRTVDPFARIERYGLALVLLIMGLFWARPHVDNLIADLRVFFQKTSDTQSQQKEILAKQDQRLEQVQRISEGTSELVRDIHGRLVLAHPRHDDGEVVQARPKPPGEK